jgi:hypothetical protein
LQNPDVVHADNLAAKPSAKPKLLQDVELAGSPVVRPSVRQHQNQKQPQDVELADSPVVRPSVRQHQNQKQPQDVGLEDSLAVKRSAKLKLLQDVELEDNLAAKSSVLLRHSPKPLLNPLPSRKRTVSTLDMPSNSLETSPPLSPRLKMMPKHSGPLSASQKTANPRSRNETLLHDVEQEVNPVERPSVMPRPKPTQRPKHDAEPEANPVASLDVLPRQLPKLSQSQSQRPDAEREGNLVARPREMLLPWPTQQTSFSQLSKRPSHGLDLSIPIDLHAT